MDITPKQVLDLAAKYIGELVQPDSTNPYMKCDKVLHLGKTWE